MSRFLSKLDRTLEAAQERGIVDAPACAEIRALAEAEDRSQGAVQLATVLAGLGGLVLVLGTILLVGANWEQIGDGVKLGALLLLIGGAHAGGFWITATGRPWAKTAAALHFTGAGLFVAGIGLVAQIYHLNSRPPNGVLLWLVAILPLAWMLRSRSITVLSAFAGVLWLEMEGTHPGSPFYLPHSFASHLAMHAGLGTLFIAVSPWLREREAEIAQTFRALGALLLVWSLFVMGFYRHFGSETHEGSLWLPLILIGAGAVALAVGARKLAPGLDAMRNRIVVLLGCVLALAFVVVLADRGALPRGPELQLFDFGWWRSYDLIEWVGTVCAWALWFTLGGWCVAFGTKANRSRYVNLGVCVIGIGVVTRFFDLVGGQTETGTLFVLGGVLLLATAWLSERWRRRLVKGIEVPA
jgi:uncharacterized membrane protein